MRKPYLLSICMMVKDEEKNLRRCLESLRPLMERVRSELIVVDTGSSDNTVTIAKEYTDKVYFHKWSNHFSDMRNITISYAQGEWIFIIDADEELDIPEDLVKVLSIKNLNKFNTIRMQVRNLMFMADKQEVYNTSERLFRNDGEFRYEGSVHNQPHFKPPIINTDVILNHYGYVNDDLELMEKKFQRTSKLLIKELEKSPENIYYRFQLSKSYLMHKEYDKALEEIRKAYDLVTPMPEQVKRERYYYVHGEYVRILFFNDKWEECIGFCDEGILLNSHYIDLYYYKAASLMHVGRKDESASVFEQYFKLYDQYQSNTTDLAKLFSVEMYSIDKRAAAISASHLSDHLYTIGSYEKSLRYAAYMHECNEKSTLFIRNYLKLKKYKELYDFYTNIQDSNLLPYFIACLEHELSSVDELEKIEVSRRFAVGDDMYAQFNAIKVSADKKAGVRHFIEKNNFNELPLNPYSQIIIYAIETGIPLNALFKKMEDAKIKIFVKAIMERSENALLYFEEFVTTNRARANDLHSNRIIAAIGNVLILTAVEEAKQHNMELPDRYSAMIDNYLLAGMQYVASLYQMNGIRMVYRTLDNCEHQFYILLYLAKEAMNNGHHKQALDYYKEAAERYPFVAGLMIKLVVGYTNQLAKVEIVSSMDRLGRDNLVPIKGVKETSNRPTKVLHGTIEIANQMNSLVTELRREDIAAKSLNYYPSYLGYPSDYVYDLTKSHPSSMQDIQQIVSKSIETFDIFHFYFNQTLMPDYSDLPLLKKENKKVIMHYLGSDVRRFSIAKNFNKYNVAKIHDENQILSILAHISKYVKHCIVADGELYEYVKDYFEHVHFLNTTIDLETYCPPIDFSFRKVKPLVVHAPTSPEIKGTKYVLKAVEDLQTKYDFDFRLVKDMSHEEAKKIYQQADIIVDQLKLGSYGVLALEAMAMGKPVITYINDFMKSYYPSELPIVSADTDSVVIELEKLLLDVELRSTIGNQGRKYVEKHHNPRLVVKKLLDIYSNV